MSFTRKNGLLHVEDISLNRIAEEFGTPTYVYSRSALESAHTEFADALQGHDSLICYAVKANSNLGILSLFAHLGTGFDIVSGGELRRVIAAGADPSKVMFSGVGKTIEEMAFALECGIHCFNVESAAELERLNDVAKAAGKIAPVSLRVNPDVDAKTHPYIATGLKENKFGIAFAEAPMLYQQAATLPCLKIIGIDCHIGSQLLDVAPFIEAIEKVLTLVDQLTADGINIEHLDIGGGLGIRYGNETPPDVADYLSPILARLNNRKLKLILEPGRRLVGNAGVLLTKIEYLKPGEEKNFAIIDAAMNDLARPALYNAWHDIIPVQERTTPDSRYDVVGPICESGDFLGRARSLAVQQNDLLAIMSAGAYSMTMSSNYNSRRRAAEVLVDGRRVHLIRKRETFESLFANEAILPDLKC